MSDSHNCHGVAPFGCKPAGWKPLQTFVFVGGPATRLRSHGCTGDDCRGVVRARRTALMPASQGVHLVVVRLLFDAGADLDKADTNGATALTCSARRGPTWTRRTALMPVSQGVHLVVVRLPFDA